MSHASQTPWRAALARSGASERHDPASVDELRALLRNLHARGVAAVPIGSGLDGCRGPEESSAFAELETSKLPVEIDPDPSSCLVRCSANTTWRALDLALGSVGLSVSDVVDARPNATVGGTLARRALLPPLWMAGTALGACIGLEGLREDGAPYRYREAPRTASGPDLRGVWFGAEGRNGVITRVTLEVRRAMPALNVLVPAAAWRELRRVLERHPQRVRVYGHTQDGDALFARSFGEGRAAALAANELLAIGATSSTASCTTGSTATSTAEPVVWPDVAALAALPWSDAAAVRTRSKRFRLRWLAAGPTHVVVAAAPSATNVESERAVLRWARDAAATHEHARWSAWGMLCPPEPSPGSSPALAGPPLPTSEEAPCA